MDFLNADAPLRAYLPPESWEGEAQFRFVFRLDNDEEPLLARLAMVQPDVNARRFMHCVLLRPENAEPERIFVADNLWYRSGRKEINSWMTPRAAKRFNWDLFETSFNDNDYTRGLLRFWFGRQTGSKTLLEFGADGWGKVYPYGENFIP